MEIIFTKVLHYFRFKYFIKSDLFIKTPYNGVILTGQICKYATKSADVGKIRTLTESYT